MVIWSQPAKLDLKQVHDFIAKDSKYYPQKVVRDIVEKSEVLDSFPEMGSCAGNWRPWRPGNIYLLLSFDLSD